MPPADGRQRMPPFVAEILEIARAGVSPAGSAGRRYITSLWRRWRGDACRAPELGAGELCDSYDFARVIDRYSVDFTRSVIVA